MWNRIGAVLLLGLGLAAQAQTDLALQAREAWVKKDRKALAAMSEQARSQQHPLAAWVDYFDLNARLGEASSTDLDAFYARWPGSYQEDRLRNDWLLELGRRRDWASFRREFAAFKMQDDREVACYALLTEHLNGAKVLEAARSAWLAQKDGDDGCQLMASSLFEAQVFTPETVWLKARFALEQNRPRVVRSAVGLLGAGADKQIAAVLDNAGRYLHGPARATPRREAEFTALALARVAASDPEQAAALLRNTWAAKLPADLQAWLWGQVGRQAAFRLQDGAASTFDRAFKLQADVTWSDELLAWSARAALRAKDWPLLQRAIALMSPAEQRSPGWTYWRARALQAQGKADEARSLLAGLAAPLGYYARLAAEELGQPTALPASPAPLTADERKAAKSHAGLSRALRAIDVGLRNEGVREWNFSLRGLNDRQLLAAAQEACDREVWDRCINSNERAKSEIDVAQRYPTPHRAALLAQTGAIGLDASYVYGLIRQESRFVLDAASHVGAKGLMQVMPATGRWTAKKLGVPFRPELIHDADYNLRLGTGYLKIVLDTFDGSQTLGAAAYNAGPGRPRRWRDGPLLEPAIWIENIPFNETRDYVRNVLANGVVYAQLLGLPGTSLRERLGPAIGPARVEAPEAPPPAAANMP